MTRSVCAESYLHSRVERIRDGAGYYAAGWRDKEGVCGKYFSRASVGRPFLAFDLT